jgi:cysteine desulfurase
MLANNETGAVQPVRDVALYCRKHGILVATDAAQAAGKISVRLTDLGDPDMVVLVGHKIGAPKGIACLYIRPGCLEQLSQAKQHHVVDGLLIGGGQEFGWRGGTPNVPYIVALGMAAERCVLNFDHKVHHMEEMRSRLLMRLQGALGESNIRVHGPTDVKLRLPNTVFVSFSGIQSGQLLQEMRYQVAASAGASCHSPPVNGSASSSSVLKAMQVPDMSSSGTVRLSLGPHLTMDQVDRAVDCLVSTVRRQWCSSRSQS